MRSERVTNIQKQITARKENDVPALPGPEVVAPINDNSAMDESADMDMPMTERNPLSARQRPVTRE